MSLELSKRLVPYLEEIETEYNYGCNMQGNFDNNVLCFSKTDFIPEYYRPVNDIKTLTLEESIEFIGKDMCNMRLLYPNAGTWLIELQFEKENLKGNSLIEVFEKFLEYCLDNDLLIK